IQKAPLVGHSMGGTVSLMASIRFPHRIEKVVIIGSPIIGSSLSLPLKMAGSRIVAERLFLHFGLFRKLLKTFSPLICKHPDFPEIIDRDLSRTNLESFLNSIRSLQAIDLRDDLKYLNLPILGLYGKHDNIVSPAQNRLLKQIIPQSEIEVFPKSGHFIMLEEPELCTHRIKKFINEEIETVP
ncbi:MAG TPA: alpha/beta hydrolase, partial [Anaerolineaceae bacterium]|nr:alpha/beta hydrolase [Anaerolineaceae bacterium]